MIKTVKRFFLSIFIVMISTSYSLATMLYVDSAPNMFGSPDYASWWTSTKADILAGNFVNMANSHDPANIGSRSFEIEDAVVYSFADLGNRLHFVYWLPGETINDLIKDNFRVSLRYQYDGKTYDLYKDSYAKRWLQPTTWEEYGGGVIGTAGFALWGGKNTNTLAELERDLQVWDSALGDVIFYTKRKGENHRIRANHDPDPVPEPASLLLLGGGLACFAVREMRRQRMRPAGHLN